MLLTLQSELVSSLTEGQRLLVKVVKANGLLDSGSYTYVFKCMSPFTALSGFVLVSLLVTVNSGNQQ